MVITDVGESEPTCASNFNYAEASAALLAALKIGGLEDISLHFWHSL